MDQLQEQIIQHILLEGQFLTQAQLDECLEMQAQSDNPKPLSFYLIQRGYLNDENLEEVVFAQRSYLTRLLKGEVTEKFGEIGVREGFFTKETLEQALAVQKKMSRGEKVRPLGEVLFLMNVLNRDQIDAILLRQGKKKFFCRCCQKSMHIKVFQGRKKYLCPTCKTPLVLTEAVSAAEQKAASPDFRGGALEKLAFEQRKSLNTLLKHSDEPKFGEIGLQHGFFSQGILDEALAIQKEARLQGREVPLGKVLSLMNALNQDQVEAILLLQGKKPLSCSRCSQKFFVNPFALEKSYVCPHCKQAIDAHQQLEGGDRKEDQSQEKAAEGLAAVPDSSSPTGELIYSEDEVNALLNRIDTLVEEKFDAAQMQQEAYQELAQQQHGRQQRLYRHISYVLLLGLSLTTIVLLKPWWANYLGRSTTKKVSTAQHLDGSSIGRVAVAPKSPSPLAKPRTLLVGTWGTNPGQFASPWQHNLFGPLSFACSASLECLLVLDQCNQRIQRFSLSGTFEETFRLPGTYYEDLTVDQAGNYYVLDAYRQRRVCIYDENGKLLAYCPLPAAIQEPQGIYHIGKELIIQQGLAFFALTVNGQIHKLPGLPTRWHARAFVMIAPHGERLALLYQEPGQPQPRRLCLSPPHTDVVLLDTTIHQQTIYVGWHQLEADMAGNTCLDQFLIYACPHGKKTVGPLVITNHGNICHRHKIRLLPPDQVLVLQATRQGLQLQRYCFP